MSEAPRRLPARSKTSDGMVRRQLPRRTKSSGAPNTTNAEEDNPGSKRNLLATANSVTKLLVGSKPKMRHGQLPASALATKALSSKNVNDAEQRATLTRARSKGKMTASGATSSSRSKSPRSRSPAVSADKPRGGRKPAPKSTGKDRPSLAEDENALEIW